MRRERERERRVKIERLCKNHSLRRKKLHLADRARIRAQNTVSEILARCTTVIRQILGKPNGAARRKVQATCTP